MTQGIIFDIKKYSIHDGPGIRTTVFFKGCPAACAWCHNPEGISPAPEILYRGDRCLHCGRCVESCPHGALRSSGKGIVAAPEKCRLCGRCAEACPTEARELVGRRVSVQEVMTEIAKDTLFYDESGGGVTFSGGEPLMQAEFLAALLKECRRQGIHTAVDTMGHAEPQLLRSLAADTDLFLFDLKHLDPAQHRRYVGLSNRVIRDNLKLLAQTPARVLVRIPLIPGINDDLAQIPRLGAFIAALETVNQVELLPYHDSAAGKYRRFGREYAMQGTGKPSGDTLHAFVEGLQAFGLKVSMGA